MKKLSTNPELMTVICNIQMMEKRIGDEINSFDKLEKMTDGQLYELQELLIPKYNNAITQEPILIIDSNRGIYMYQTLANQILDGTLKCKNFDDIKKYAEETAKGPDYEFYFESFEDLERNAILTGLKGQEYTIYQHEDIWAIPVNMPTDKFEEYFGQ